MNNGELKDFESKNSSGKNDLFVEVSSASEERIDQDFVSSEDIERETETESSNRKVFKKLEKGTTAYEIFDWVRTICIGILAGIFIVVFLVQRDDVYGSSMMPTTVPKP